MPYTRHHWTNGPASTSRLSASFFNNIEDGVEEATDAVRGRLSEAALETTIGAVVAASASGPFEAAVQPKALESTVKTALPWDGSKVATSLAIYCPLWSVGNYVFATAPVTIGGVQQTRLCRLNKATLAVEQNVQLKILNHDGLTGHREASVAVDENSTLIVHPHGHHNAWAGLHSTTILDGSTLTATPAPTGIGTNSSYRRFFRDPYTGAVWLVARGDSYGGRIYRWNATSKTWELRGSNPATAAGFGGYGLELAFGKGVMFAVTEFISGNSGYPRRDIGIVRSYDQGATWQNMAGVAVTGGISPSNVTVVFPHTPDVDPTVFPAGHNAVASRIAVLPDGSPVVFASWVHPTVDDEFRSLWAARVDPFTGDVQLTRVAAALSNWDIGNCHVAYTPDGFVAVTVSQRDDHLPLASDPGNSEVNSTNYPDSPFWLFTTTDGRRFVRYTLDPGTNGLGISGGYIDLESMRRDGVVRVLPVFSRQPAKSELWTLTLSDPPVPEVGANDGSPELGEPDAPVLSLLPLDGQINVTWDTIPDNGYPVTSVKLYRGTSAGVSTAGAAYQTIASGATGFADTGLTNGTTYYYKAIAVNSAGDSPASAEVSSAASASDWRTAEPTGTYTKLHHLRADDVIGVADGAAIGTWPASAGSDAITPSGAATSTRPVFRLNGGNRRPVVKFTAAQMQRLVSAGDARADDRTFIAVVKVPSVSGTGTHIINNATADARVAAGPQVFVDSNGLRVQAYAQSGNEAIAPGVTSGQLAILSGGWSVSPGRTLFAQVNKNTKVTTNGTSYSSANPDGLAIVGVGSTLNGTVDVQEILWFNDLISDVDRTAWIDYLATIYGITV